MNDSSLPSKPTAEALTPESLTKKVMSESLQHPSTLIPAATAILSGMYMSLIQPSPTAFALGLAAGTVSIISFLFHYFVRGETIMRREVGKLSRERKQSERQDAEALVERCQTAGFSQGADVGRDLLNAFDRMIVYLRDKFPAERRASSERFTILSEEVLSRGLTLIRRSLDLFEAIREINYEKMTFEMAQWQRDLNSGVANDPQMQALLRQRLSSHQKRLDLHASHQKSLMSNLSQCEVLEAGLDASYLELLNLSASETLPGSEKSGQNLQRMVEATKRVEEKLRMGNSHQQSDEMYDISKQKEGQA